MSRSRDNYTAAFVVVRAKNHYTGPAAADVLAVVVNGALGHMRARAHNSLA